MFTGIVDHQATIARAESRPGFLRLWIETRFSELALGESISVDGACLTVVEADRGTFLCELSEETLRLTVAGTYRPGQAVNVERALRLGDRLGGHYVTGHVDGVGYLEARQPVDACVHMVFAGLTPDYRPFVLLKGSITVNGVSLTVNGVSESKEGHQAFEVMVIPHTLERTNLGSLAVGAKVNLEFDWMTKVILSDARKVRGLLEEQAK